MLFATLAASCVYVCACACVRVCARVCLSVCVCVRRLFLVAGWVHGPLGSSSIFLNLSCWCLRYGAGNRPASIHANMYIGFVFHRIYQLSSSQSWLLLQIMACGKPFSDEYIYIVIYIYTYLYIYISIRWCGFSYLWCVWAKVSWTNLMATLPGMQGSMSVWL